MTRQVVVLGDALLDVDVETTSERLVPDSTAPVLDEIGRSNRPGGAALAAIFAAADPDTDVTLVTAIGADDGGDALRATLAGRVGLVELPATGATGVKIRLRHGSDTVARLDQGGRYLRVHDLSAAAREAIDAADAVLVSDYGRQLSTAAGIPAALAAAAARLPVIWDPHPRGAVPVPGCRVVTPNAAEAGHATREAPPASVGAACRQARALVTAWAARGVALTLGARGAVLAAGTDSAAVYPAPRSVGGDPCGAGDRFAARLATAIAAGALTSEAVAAAVDAASAFVARGGVAHLDAACAPAPDDDHVESLLARVRASGGLVVATGGCFDVLHAGHVATLDAARSLGDCLIVCVNSDASVRRQKGAGRPVQPCRDRVRLLEALRAVDAVVVFDEDTPQRVIADLRPDLWVKGGDYAGAELPESELVRSWGGEVVTVPYLAGRSTTSVLSRIKA
jgi:rfaE bifunctional protein nucleotidyltransferase chain/domain